MPYYIEKHDWRAGKVELLPAEYIDHAQATRDCNQLNAGSALGYRVIRLKQGR